MTLLRIATWNPRRRLGPSEAVRCVNGLNAHLLVLPEYGRGGSAIGSIQLHRDRPRGYGIAVAASYGTLIGFDSFDPALPCVLLLVRRLPDEDLEIRVLAIWARDYTTACLLTMWFALDRWASWLAEGPAILLGDLNQSCAWQRERPVHFKDIVERLLTICLTSAWHSAWNEIHGRESVATWCGNKGSAHTDFIFVGINFLVNACSAVSAPSDHSAVIADVRA